ncbi:MAG: lytic murein transglycosylase [Hyphomicrobiales bacterium]|nr:lytic murein transglycosylase [Hyphomicrobiales bacterium]
MKNKPSVVILLVLIVTVIPSSAFALDQARIQRQFGNWLNSSLWPEAKRNGISRSVFNLAFDGVTLRWDLPDLVIPGAKKKKNKAQSQAEFRGPSVYFSENNLISQAKTGRALYQKWRVTLKKIENFYGVPGHFLIAIWGRESAFGKAKIPFSAVRVLATKAFMSSRKDLFRQELLSALVILQKYKLTSGNLKGSWAGALGQPQFMPSSYLKYAVDFDGDGKKDIWKSVPDTFASIANYLSENGWINSRDWGYEVRIPADLSCAQEGPDRARTISQWISMGVKRVSGRPFPASESAKNAMMMVPAGRNGPHFIVTDNFYVIKKYNNSDLYALYVGNLADRIAYGSGPFKTRWSSHEKLLRSQIAGMQRKLERLKYDVGGADGLPGYKTRRSIGEWQIKSGLNSTCFPDRKLIRKIR